MLWNSGALDIFSDAYKLNKFGLDFFQTYFAYSLYLRKCV